MLQATCQDDGTPVIKMINRPTVGIGGADRRWPLHDGPGDFLHPDVPVSAP